MLFLGVLETSDIRIIFLQFWQEGKNEFLRSVLVFRSNFQCNNVFCYGDT